jgi:thiol-disulfide isomerase/thioredoxin
MHRRVPALVALVALVVISVAGSPACADPKIGEAAPALDLPALDGKNRLSTLKPDRPVTIVDFFATWCGPCHLALEALDQLAASLGEQATLLVVDVGEDRDTVAAFFSAHPLRSRARVLLDPDEAAGRRWGRHRFPTTFLVDDRGVIRHINRGYGPGYSERLERWARSMLPAPSPPAPTR